MSDGVKKFKRFVKKFKIPLKIIILPSSTRTAVEAAHAIGCQVAQIAKSIVFKTSSGMPILVITSGINQVDEKKLAKMKIYLNSQKFGEQLVMDFLYLKFLLLG
ncbi:MAG: YbaK/EbsC family protein [Microgenomates group bacterium]